MRTARALWIGLENRHDVAVRALGLIPLALFALTVAKYAMTHQLYDVLWMCNIANLAVGAGLLSGRPALTKVGAIWILSGTAAWLGDGLYAGRFETLPVFTHFATTMVAVYGVARTVGPRGASLALRAAAPGLLALQGVSRLATPGMANVNFAFESYYGVWAWFPPGRAYPAFWLAVTAVMAASFVLAELALHAVMASWGRDMPISARDEGDSSWSESGHRSGDRAAVIRARRSSVRARHRPG